MRNRPKKENVHVVILWCVTKQQHMKNKKVKSKTMVLNCELVQDMTTEKALSPLIHKFEGTQ